MTSPFERPLSDLNLAQGLTLEDNWFALKQLDSGTWAIGEPAYHQMNWSYLLASDNEALVFDTGSGYRPIQPLISRLTSARVTAFPSHMHHDHLGNIAAFPRVLLADLPILRSLATDNEMHIPEDMFLGAFEGQTPPPFKVTRWANLAQPLILGSRTLHILPTPGHSPDSVSLYEPASDTLFAADFLYRGGLYAQVPHASLPAYLTSAKRLMSLPKDTRILGAHGSSEPCDAMPELTMSDLSDLSQTLEKLLAGPPQTGETPVNARMSLKHSAASFTN